jgi:hypothetical protein
MWLLITGFSQVGKSLFAFGNEDNLRKHNLELSEKGAGSMSNTYCSNSLVDIRTVSVDRALSRDARITEFIRQIRNPYKFKCGKFTITAKYADTGLTLEDCLVQIMN